MLMFGLSGRGGALLTSDNSPRIFSLSISYDAAAASTSACWRRSPSMPRVGGSPGTAPPPPRGSTARTADPAAGTARCGNQAAGKIFVNLGKIFVGQ